MKDIKIPQKKEEVVIDIEQEDDVQLDQNQESFSEEKNKGGSVSKQDKKLKYRRIRKIVAFCMLLVVVFVVTTLFSQYQVYLLKKKLVSSLSSHMETSELQDPNKVIEAVSRHLITPTTTPQVALVEDVAKLRSSQPFFKEALNGDVVLMYKTMIILYRPSKDIIVTVGDIRGE